MIPTIRKKRCETPADARVALLKFERTGPTAAPLTRDEVALILGIAGQSVCNLVGAGKLKRMPTGFYHPDDVRAYMYGEPKNAKQIAV
jgi:hypothetical protein